MKKIGLVCMLVTTFYAYSTQARVCLLGDPNCNSGISVDSAQKCEDYLSKNPKWIHESDTCNALDYRTACEDYKDVYYIELGCKQEYIDIQKLNNSNYVCAEEIQCEKCCPSIKCSDQYKECHYPTQGDYNDTCEEPDKTIKFSRCLCDENKYKYNTSNCAGIGMHLEGEQCSGDNGDWWERCICSAPSECKWTDANKGNNGVLSNQCCDGTYKTCTKNFPTDVEVPANATATKTSYTACGETKEIITGWTCNLGYVQDPANTGCDVAQCPQGSSIIYTDASKCGYASTIGASVTSTGEYSEGKLCYTCNCSVPSACKWTDANKGDKGTLKDVCCDGQTYKTCTKNFPTDVTVPSNATATKTSYTACDETKEIVTGWDCNDGYVKNSAGTGCDVAQCPTGSKTEYSDVSKCGYPSTIGKYDFMMLYFGTADVNPNTGSTTFEYNS